jgi:hypothetical protein
MIAKLERIWNKSRRFASCSGGRCRIVVNGGRTEQFGIVLQCKSEMASGLSLTGAQKTVRRVRVQPVGSVRFPREVTFRKADRAQAPLPCRRQRSAGNSALVAVALHRRNLRHRIDMVPDTRRGCRDAWLVFGSEISVAIGNCRTAVATGMAKASFRGLDLLRARNPTSRGSASTADFGIWKVMGTSSVIVYCS